MKEKKFTLKTYEGSKRLFVLFLVVLLISALFARAFQNDFGKIKIQQVTFDSRGAVINAELYYPVGTSDRDSLPAIITTHGGGCTLGVSKGMASELARRGFVVLNVSAYGTGLSDQPVYDEANQGVDGFNMMVAVNGLYDALNYIRTLHFVDPTRIGAVGHSMGAMRTFSAACMDSGYMSMNDQMLNVLYEVFGQTITEDQINDDADEMAKNLLTTEQLAHYETIKAEKQAVYDTRIKAEVALGIGAFGRAFQQTVNVAGHEVTRSAQTNIAFITGALDSLWGFTEGEGTRAAWYAPDGFKQDTWYSVDDASQTNTELGAFGQVSVASDPAFKVAIDGRVTRLLQSTGMETHSKEFFSSSTNAALIEYFSQTLDWNRGNLSDGSAKPLAADKQIWGFRAFFNFVSMMSMFGMIFAVAGILLKSKRYSVCVAQVDDSARPAFNKTRYWIFNAAAVVIAFLAIYLANKNGLFFFDQSKALPLGRTAVLTVYFLLMLCLGSIVVLGINIALTKKETGETGLSNVNLKLPASVALKMIAIALIMIVAGYYALATSEYLFGQDFRLWMSSLGSMKNEWWTLGVNYAVILFPLYLILSVCVNYSVRTDIPEWKDTLYTVIFNSLGVWICCLMNILIALGSYEGTLFSSFICSYQFVFWVPMTTYIARKMYLMTKSVWTGAMLNTCIICWSMLSTLGVNDTYFGPNFISNFFNV